MEVGDVTGKADENNPMTTGVTLVDKTGADVVLLLLLLLIAPLIKALDAVSALASVRRCCCC